MKPATVESVINAVASCVHLSFDAEINLEANPTSTEVKKLRLVVANRLLITLVQYLALSQGVQRSWCYSTLPGHTGRVACNCS